MIRQINLRSSQDASKEMSVVNVDMSVTPLGEVDKIPAYEKKRVWYLRNTKRHLLVKPQMRNIQEKLTKNESFLTVATKSRERDKTDDMFQDEDDKE